MDNNYKMNKISNSLTQNLFEIKSESKNWLHKSWKAVPLY